MDQKIKEVIDELIMLCEKAGINENQHNLLHVLIAYLRIPKIKEEEDYAINAVVASLINDILPHIKEEDLKVTKSELAIFCKSIMINNEEGIEVKNNSEIGKSEIPLRTIILDSEDII